MWLRMSLLTSDTSKLHGVPYSQESIQVEAAVVSQFQDILNWPGQLHHWLTSVNLAIFVGVVTVANIKKPLREFSSCKRNPQLMPTDQPTFKPSQLIGHTWSVTPDFTTTSTEMHTQLVHQFIQQSNGSHLTNIFYNPTCQHPQSAFSWSTQTQSQPQTQPM